MEEAQNAPSAEKWLKVYVDQHFADFFGQYGGDLKEKYTPKWVSSFFNAFIDLEQGQATQFVIPDDLRQFFLENRANLKIFLSEKAHHLRRFSSAPLDIQTLIESAINILENAMRGAEGISESDSVDVTTRLIRERILFIVHEENLKALLDLYTKDHLDNFLKAHPFQGKPSFDPIVQFTYLIIGQYGDMDRYFVTYLLQNSRDLVQDIKTKFSGENDAVLFALEAYLEKKMDDMKTVIYPLPAIHFRPTEPLTRPAGLVDRNAVTPIPKPGPRETSNTPIISRRVIIGSLAMAAVLGAAVAIKYGASTDPRPSTRVSAPASPPRLPKTKDSAPAPSLIEQARVQTPTPARVVETPHVSPATRVSPAKSPPTPPRAPREPRLPHRGERLRNAPAHRVNPVPVQPQEAQPEAAPTPRPIAIRNIRIQRYPDGVFRMSYSASGAIIGALLVVEQSRPVVDGYEIRGRIEATCRGRACRSDSFTANTGQAIAEIRLDH